MSVRVELLLFLLLLLLLLLLLFGYFDGAAGDTLSTFVDGPNLEIAFQSGTNLFDDYPEKQKSLLSKKGIFSLKV